MRVILSSQSMNIEQDLYGTLIEQYESTIQSDTIIP